MLKFAYFELDDAKTPKDVAPLKGQKFYNFSVVTDFISAIGEQNIVSISHLNYTPVIPACVIAYHDNELLTCPSCTREISNGFKFCPECATKLK